MVLTKTIARLSVNIWNKNPIRNPGIYSDIPIETYHSKDICVEPSLSSSGMRKLYSPLPWVKASPAHYWCNSPYNEKRLEDEEESSALILGRAAHHVLFTQEDFNKQFIVRPNTINGEACNRRTRQGILWHERQSKAGLTVLTQDQMQAIRRIAEELAKDPLVRNGCLNGFIEHSWFWKHRSGVWLKIRPDATPNDSLDFVDLKITHSIMWPDLQRTIRDYGYWMQAGLTAMGVKAILGLPMNSFTLVFCESKEPHCIEIVTLKPHEIDRGIQACEIAIAKFNKCWNEKQWPGPRGGREDAQYIEMLEHDQKRIDEALQFDRETNGGTR